MQPRARVSAALGLLVSLTLAACNGGGSPAPFDGTAPAPTPSPSASAAPSNETAYTCPSSDTAASAARGGGVSSASFRRTAARAQRGVQTVDGLIAVSYARQTLSASRSAVSAKERSLGASLVNELDFPHAGVTTRVLSVAASQVATVQAALRPQAGVQSVDAVQRRFPTTVAQPYWPNNPYFDGFTATQIATAVADDQGPSGSPTYEILPYVENQNVPGQWGMHAVQLEHAFGYSLSGNTVGANANALGSSSVKIALIDTGQDTNHPELKSKVVYQKCFITDPNGNQSTSNFTTDSDGHGTDVAGIAAAALNGNLGFAGAGGNSVIYGYRIYPTPDDNCVNSSSTDPQCSASTADVASAIMDAIAQKVNVISLSLGGGECSSSGADGDPTEGKAIQEALAANIVIVAAAGNDGSSPLEAPACDTYPPNGAVIAAGASALDDGQANASGHTGGTAANPVEYVASYSDYGSPGATFGSASAWGIVAPGGDATGSGDNDDLHWIQNIWTTQPLDGNFAGACGPDYGASSSSTADCQIEIAGTSMSTPVVAGVAALIIAVAPQYGTPTAMKTLLCSTADQINDAHEGCGRLNASRAMAVALNDPAKP
jgi:subtilisin family serine protease